MSLTVAAAPKAVVDAAKPIAHGEQRAQTIADKVVPNYYGNPNTLGQTYGIVSMVGKAKIAATRDPNVFIATGTFNGNTLWGGARNYSFKVQVSSKTGQITPVTKPIPGKVTN